MKIIMATFIVAFCYLLTSASAQTTTVTLDSKSGADCVWVNSSAPPATNDDDKTHPVWKRASTSADSSLGEKPISGMNNVWYPLEERTKDLRIGGWGGSVCRIHACANSNVFDYVQESNPPDFSRSGSWQKIAD
jgi:hypothetical protein